MSPQKRKESLVQGLLLPGLGFPIYEIKVGLIIYQGSYTHDDACLQA